MTKYREIIRLHCMGYSKRNIALSVPCSRNTAARVADRADDLRLKWPLPENYTDGALEKLLFPKTMGSVTERKMPDMQYVRKELQKNGVTKKLLWTARRNGKPLCTGIASPGNRSKWTGPAILRIS